MNMDREKLEEELFHYIEKATIEGIENGEIGILIKRAMDEHGPIPIDGTNPLNDYIGNMKVVILDKWKGQLTKKIADYIATMEQSKTVDELFQEYREAYKKAYGDYPQNK